MSEAPGAACAREPRTLSRANGERDNTRKETPVTLLSKTLPPAQEAEITRKLDTAARLDFPEFQRRSLKSPAFRKWFKGEYGADPIFVSEKITPDIRAAFMAYWARELREIEAVKLTLAELDALPEVDDAEDIGPDLPLIRTRAPTVPGDDGERETRTDPPDATIMLDPVSPPKPDYPYPGDDDPGVILLDEWCRKFRGLSEEQEAEWEAKHIARQVYAGPFLQTVYLEPLPDAVIPDSLAEFESYTETVRRDFARLRNVSEFEGTTLADDDPPDEKDDYLIDKLVYVGPSITFVWGLPDAGKSMQFQKASVAVSSETTADLDGFATLHGPVLYVSLDLGARQKRLKRRMRQIADKLGIPYSARLVLVHDEVNLTDPKSVAALIKRWPGPWAMIVLDPLNKMVGGGDLSQPTVMIPALASIKRLAVETDSAVVVITHPDKKDTDIYGTIFQRADADIILHMVRHYQKDGQARNGDTVTMTWGRDKNGSPPDKPMKYIIDEAYLAPFGAPAGAIVAARVNAKRPDILAKLPTTATAKAKAFKLIESMLNGKTPETRAEQWRRLWKAWEAAGLVVVKGDTIQRVV